MVKNITPNAFVKIGLYLDWIEILKFDEKVVHWHRTLFHRLNENTLNSKFYEGGGVCYYS